MKQTQKQSWTVPPSSQVAVLRHEYARAVAEGLSHDKAKSRAKFLARAAQHFGLDLAGWLQYTGQL